MTALTGVVRIQLLIILSFFSINSVAQKSNQLINSGEVIEQGNKKYASEDYKGAIALYSQVDKSDTNYVVALSELANAYFADSQNVKTLEIARIGMERFPEKYSSFMMHAANSMDNLQMFDESQALYDSAIKRNPNNYLLYYNKAITNYNLKNYDVAKSNFQASLLINPYYAPSHFFLGSLYLNEGNLVPAMLAYSTSLLISPSGPTQSKAIALMTSISKGEDLVQGFVKTKNPASEKNFNAIQTIVLSKIALDNKYKSLTDLEDVMLKQLQVIMEKLEYKPGDNSFAMQYYVPFFINTFKEKDFEPLIYSMFSDINLPQIQNWLSRNKKKREQFTGKAISYFNSIRNSRVLNAEQREKNELLYVFRDNTLIAHGLYKNNSGKQEAQGKWEFFTEDGLVMLEGAFGNGEKKQGVWTSFYNSGNVKEKFTYKDGELNGKAEGWFDNGNKWYEENYKDGILEGKQTIYNYNSLLRNDFNFSKGMKNGEQKIYNIKGELIEIAFFKDDKLDGPFKTFYESGKVRTESSFAADKENGDYKSYFESGQVYQAGKLIDGKREGLWTTYYEDGKIESKTTYAGNEVTGEYEELYNNGLLKSKGRYDKKKLDGKVIYNDDDGKLYCEAVYDKGRLREITFYDKTGKIISSTSTKKGAAHIVFYSANGNKTSEGKYDKDGLQQGKHVEYYSSGLISEEANYKDGELHGPFITYYTNGKILTETNYKNGLEDGYYKNYFLNGKSRYEGWMVAGEKQQSWLSYNVLGDLVKKEYYISDNLNGYTQYYYPGNVLDYEFYYKNGWLEQVLQVDTTGKLIQNNKFPGGDGKLVFRHYNGKTLSETGYKYYLAHGKKQSYFFDGSISATNELVKDRKEGKFTSYFYGGKIKKEGNYKADEAEGLWKTYYSNGSIYSEEPYEKGSLNGTWKGYFPNGELNLAIDYKKGKIEGDYTYYGGGNEKAVILNFKDDRIMSYQYEMAPGKLSEPVLLKNYSGKISAKYPNGKPSADFTYHENAISGKMKIYYSNGNVKSEATLVNGHYDGERKVYHPNGKLYRVENFVLGQLHGPRTIYNEDGIVLSEENYYDDELHGKITYRDPKTKKVLVMNYYHGFSISSE